MPENPFQSPTNDSVPSEDERNRQARATYALWRGFLIAPATAPLCFVLLLLGVGVVATLFGVEVNPASFLVLPVIALTVGLGASYLVAVLVGLPIVLLLRRRGKLTGRSLCLASLLTSLLFALVFSTLSFRGPGIAFLMGFSLVLLVVALPSLLATTILWLLVRKSSA